MKVASHLLVLVCAATYANDAAAAKYKCKDSAGNWSEAACAGTAAAAPPSRPKTTASENGVPPMREALLRRCEREWPTDFSMQTHCVEKQSKAALEVSAVTRSPAAIADQRRQNALVECAERWKDGDTWDWSMVMYCYSKQDAAIQQMDAERGK